jgi:hypothetical protein
MFTLTGFEPVSTVSWPDLGLRGLLLFGPLAVEWPMFESFRVGFDTEM